MVILGSGGDGRERPAAAFPVETVVEDVAIEAPFDTATVDLMASVLRAEDPGARAVPYMISGGTDAKAFTRIGDRLLRVLPAADAGRSRLLAPVPRRRRARSGLSLIHI